jgi:hypothetical protein
VVHPAVVGLVVDQAAVIIAQLRVAVHLVEDLTADLVVVTMAQLRVAVDQNLIYPHPRFYL